MKRSVIGLLQNSCKNTPIKLKEFRNTREWDFKAAVWGKDYHSSAALLCSTEKKSYWMRKWFYNCYEFSCLDELDVNLTLKQDAKACLDAHRCSYSSLVLKIQHRWTFQYIYLVISVCLCTFAVCWIWNNRQQTLVTVWESIEQNRYGSVLNHKTAFLFL